LKIQVTEDHIYHAKWASSFCPNDPRRDAIITAIQDAGIDEVKVEIHLNHLPPRHDWAIELNGKRYAMTHGMVRYYDDFRIEQGHRTKPAELIFDDEAMTVDVRVKRYVSYARQLGYKTLNLGGHWE